MPVSEIERQLDEACRHLEAAQHLLVLNAPCEAWAESFWGAAEALRGVACRKIESGQRPGIEKRLNKLQRMCGCAGRLLDSAANFYFGRVLIQGRCESGYQADGQAVSIGGRCMAIDA